MFDRKPPALTPITLADLAILVLALKRTFERPPDSFLNWRKDFLRSVGADGSPVAKGLVEERFVLVGVDELPN